MLYYSRNDVSKGIDVFKASKSKECHIWRDVYSLNHRFKVQPNVFSGCHDLLKMSMNLYYYKH